MTDRPAPQQPRPAPLQHRHVDYQHPAGVDDGLRQRPARWTPTWAYGYLWHTAQAAMLRGGETLPRRCRWCSCTLRWSPRAPRCRHCDLCELRDGCDDCWQH